MINKSKNTISSACLFEPIATENEGSSFLPSDSEKLEFLISNKLKETSKFFKVIEEEDLKSKTEKNVEDVFSFDAKNLVASWQPKEELFSEFIVLQKWEGSVHTVFEDSFSAILSDLIDDRVEEIGEFPLDMVSESDKILFEPGAIFYCYVGYSISRSGQRTKGTQLRFRRLPAWNKREINMAKKRIGISSEEIIRPEVCPG